MFKDSWEIIEACFKKARITGELSDSSMIKYRDSLKVFFSLVNIEIEKIEPVQFDDFILAMRDRGASNSRIANVISAVKWILDKSQKEKLIKIDYDLALIKKPKIPKREVDYLTEEEERMFIGAIQDDIKAGLAIRKVRMMALTNFLLQTGSRIGETLLINRNDIDRRNMEVSVIGKGNKQRTLFLNSQTLYWIDEYLSLRKDEKEALFVSLNGKSRWQQTDAGRSFRRYKRLSGIKKHFTIHTLRHTFATNYLMRGAGINVVQTALGHADAITTLKYYAGAVNKVKVREMINDNHFNFISRTTLLCYRAFD